MALYIGNTRCCPVLQEGGGTNIYDEIRDCMFSIVPSSNPYNDNSAALYNFVDGKTYKVVVKLKYAPSADSIGFYAYRQNSNSPAASIGFIYPSENVNMKEFTYTHSAGTTYTRIGMWVNASSERTGKFSAVVYIKEI